MAVENKLEAVGLGVIRGREARDIGSDDRVCARNRASEMTRVEAERTRGTGRRRRRAGGIGEHQLATGVETGDRTRSTRSRRSRVDGRNQIRHFRRGAERIDIDRELQTAAGAEQQIVLRRAVALDAASVVDRGDERVGHSRSATEPDAKRQRDGSAGRHLQGSTAVSSCEIGDQRG